MHAFVHDRSLFFIVGGVKIPFPSNSPIGMSLSDPNSQYRTICSNEMTFRIIWTLGEFYENAAISARGIDKMIIFNSVHVGK